MRRSSARVHAALIARIGALAANRAVALIGLTSVIAVIAVVASVASPALAQNEPPSLRDRIRQMRPIDENDPEPPLGRRAAPKSDQPPRGATGEASVGAPEGPARIDKAGTYTYRLEHGGLKRKYLVHVPASWRSSPAAPAAPVVLALHGGGGFAEYQASDEHYGLISKADLAGFIAVFPNGWSPLRNGTFATWNAGTCCAGARDRNIDDVGFLRAVVDDVARRVAIDRARVYSIGMSNGGLMSYRLACDAPDLIRGVMAVAGTDNTTSCDPRKPVSILHVHAKNDDHVRFEGGAGAGTRDASKVTHFRSVAHTIDKWVKLNRCNPEPARVLDVPGATCDLYSGCAEGTRVKLCVTERGAHSWPGGAKTRGSEPTSKAIVANDVMWEFFNGR